MSASLDLRFLWWLILGALVASVGVLLTAELGLSVLLRYLGRTETERHRLIKQFGLLSGAGRIAAILAGSAVAIAWWPVIHTTLFSGLWFVLLFLVLALIAQPLLVKYRDRINTASQRHLDLLSATIALATLLVLGVGVGVSVSGAPYHFDAGMQVHWDSFGSRFTPFEVLIPGLLSVTAGLWLCAARVCARSDAILATRARRLLIPLGGAVLVLFILGAIWTTQMNGYAVAGLPAVGGSPLAGSTFAMPGAYLERFMATLPLAAVPLLAGISLFISLFFAWRGPAAWAWRPAALGITATVATAGVMTYPVIVPSTTSPSQSLTLWNAASNPPILIALLAFVIVLLVGMAVYQFKRRPDKTTVKMTNNILG